MSHASNALSNDDFDMEMEDFGKLFEESIKAGSQKEGSVITGVVISIEKDIVIVDVGLKSEGRIPLREFQVGNAAPELKPGDEVEVYLERIENRHGDAVLSREKALREEAWTKLEKACAKQERVEGVIFGRVKGGFTVDIQGAVAFLPGSQVDIRPIRDVGPLMHIKQPFMILKMDRKRGNIVVSRRAILEESRTEQRDQLLSKISEGQIIDGIVKNLTDYGAFIDMGGIDGLLHVTDISWRRIAHPSEVLHLGQTVKVMVTKYDQNTKRVSLGIKQLDSDPFENEVDGLKKGATVTCTVAEIRADGIVVKVTDHIQSFVKKADLARERQEQRPERFAVGDRVDVKIVSVEKDTRKIGASIKALEAEEHKKAIAEYGSESSGAVLGDILGAALSEAKEAKPKKKKS